MGEKMKKLLFGTLFTVFVVISGGQAFAQADVKVNVNIGLPPPVAFPAPPALVVLPGTYIYAVPGAEADIFFFNGWWWRPWEGRWYRSRHYDSGWVFYRNVPAFYKKVPQGWRDDYRAHRWEGRPWNYERINHNQAQKNWRNWERDRYWEKRQTWGVQGYQPRMRGQQHRPQAVEAKPERSFHRQETPTPARRGVGRSQREEAPPMREDRPHDGDRERGNGERHRR
jgi:hypothetical protein